MRLPALAYLQLVVRSSEFGVGTARPALNANRLLIVCFVWRKRDEEAATKRFKCSGHK